MDGALTPLYEAFCVYVEMVGGKRISAIVDRVMKGEIAGKLPPEKKNREKRKASPSEDNDTNSNSNDSDSNHNKIDKASNERGKRSAPPSLSKEEVYVGELLEVYRYV